MRFEFATAVRILFGPGTVEQVPALAAEFGRRALVVRGGSAERAAPLLAALAAQGIECEWFSVRGEPTLATASQATQRARQMRAELVIGFGGGSPLDVGKAAAALVTNGGEPLDYGEVIGRGKVLSRPSLPFLAVPTTAGTGTEATRNAVLTSPEHQIKVSLRSIHTLPRVAVVDPELTYSVPPETTAHTGLDALAQLIEPYVGLRANPLTDGLCLEGMGRVARSLRRAYADGQDRQAREDMALASLLSGIALANGGLGAVHGFAGPFGAMFEAPHGAVCARLLAPVMQVNLRLAREQVERADLVRRYETIARVLTGQPTATPEDGVAWVKDLAEDLGVPSLASFGLTAESVAALTERAAATSSMRGNPVPLSTADLREIVEKAM